MTHTDLGSEPSQSARRLSPSAHSHNGAKQDAPVVFSVEFLRKGIRLLMEFLRSVFPAKPPVFDFDAIEVDRVARGNRSKVPERIQGWSQTGRRKFEGNASKISQL